MTILTCPKYYNFSENLVFLNRNDKECLHEVGINFFRRLVKIDQRLVLVEVKKISEKTVGLNILSKHKKSDVEIAASFIKEWLGWNDPIQGFYRMAKKDRLLAPLATKFKGLYLVGIPDLFEALSWAIIGQQINLNFAYQIKRKLVEKYGAVLKYKNQTYYYFPTPSDIAVLKKEDLLALQFSRQKAEYLLGIAQLMVDASFDKSSLSAMPYDIAKKELIKVRGIGNWTADYVLMKCIRCPNALPVQDAGLQNAIKAQLELEKKPSVEMIEELAQPWAGFEALACFYLWRSLLVE